jgi:hypothetical protein
LYRPPLETRRNPLAPPNSGRNRFSFRIKAKRKIILASSTARLAECSRSCPTGFCSAVKDRLQPEFPAPTMAPRAKGEKSSIFNFY